MFWYLVFVSGNSQISKQKGHGFAARGIRFESGSPMISCGTFNPSLGYGYSFKVREFYQEL